jgi:hypothetical protein
MSLLSTFAQSTNYYNNTDTSSALYSATVLAVIIAVIVLFCIFVYWKVYVKAGKPGWAAIIPIYNLYVLLKIVDRPGWWLLLFLIPFVNVVVAAIVAVDLAHSFGKSTMFGIFGLWLFSIIGYAMLGFGSAKYSGPSKPAPAKQAAV